MGFLRVNTQGDAEYPVRLLENDLSATADKPHIVIIVENMPVPLDRRVWQQATALIQDGWRVSVICPKGGAYRAGRENLEGVEIYRHSLPCEANGLLGYLAEYSGALVMELVSLFRIGLGKIDIVQICNPPDFLFIPALAAKWFGGARIIFDHHDLTPELLVEKTGKKSGTLLNFAQWAERMTFQTASHVISTNSSFAEIAQVRGDKLPEDISIVYSAPDLKRMRQVAANPALLQGRSNLIFWIGMIGSQDGVDLLLGAVRILRAELGCDDFHLMIAGDGPERITLMHYAEELQLTDMVSFPGFLTGEQLFEALSTASIGVGSDPKNEFNDRLAMNKIMEYMAYGLPIAMFDLAECRKIAGDAALIAENNDPRALALCLKRLLEDKDLCKELGNLGHDRLLADYTWESQKEIYLTACRKVLEAA
ncbi:MAG: glycosyltransferase family 4 protein [Aquisalinus sp.]|nr:glycosyltransferase family 4 protein [Aquisalinus sp.]